MIPMRDVVGATREATSDRVQATPHLVEAVVRHAAAGRLHRQRVVDRDEVEQAPLGLSDQVGPVPAGEQLARPGALGPPGGGVPAGPVEGDRQMQRWS